MSNFINTSYNDALDFATDTAKDIIKNSLYLYNDKKSLKTTYYHINTDKSTLDEAARIPYADLGLDCPFRFDVIHNMILFGAEKIQLSLENGEVGLESGDIEGEATILPNTIIPYPGDYFEIDHIEDAKWLFKVNGVSKDTLDDGANAYQIQYKLEHTGNENILPLVVGEYDMVVSNIGTQMTPILKSSVYELVEKMDEMDVRLKRYFKEIFYDTKVQTFIYQYYYESRLYDPYMVEFLIRNKILSQSGQKDYIFVEHKTALPNTFGIDYERSFLHSLELRDVKHLKYSNSIFNAEQIDNIMSIFHRRPEIYFMVREAIDSRNDHFNPIVSLDRDIVDAIVDEKYYEQDSDREIYNIIIKFFHKREFDDYDFDMINHIDYHSNTALFYLIPMLIYCIETTIKELMRTTYK